MSWSGIQAALHAWVVAATGISAERVYFANQNNPRPVGGAFATIALEDIDTVGRDRSLEDYDVTRDTGLEVRLRTSGLREFGVEVQVFTAIDHGDSTARAFAGRCQVAANAQGRRDAFKAAGFSMFDVGQVRSVPKVYETDTEGRAQLVCRCYTQVEFDEFVGWIESVEVTGTVTADDDDIEVPFTVPA